MARIFDGTGDYSVSAASFNNNANVCISFKFLIPTGHGNIANDRIFELGGVSQVVGGVTVAHETTTTILYFAVWDKYTNSTKVGSGLTYTLDTWHTVLITMQQTSISNVIYVDGTSIGTNTTRKNGGLAARFTIGAQNNTPASNQGSCRVAEVAIWEGVILNVSDSKALMSHSPLFVRPDKLVGYWPLVRGSSTVDTDLINNSSLTVTNAAATPHPLVINPSAQILQFPSAAAAGNVCPQAYHHRHHNRAG